MTDLWWADPDPWALTAAEQQAADERHRRMQQLRDAIPDEPYF